MTNKKSCVVNVRLYQNMIEIFDIYVSITIYLLQYIYIILGWKNIQHSMLANPDYNKISIENYYQEIFQIFMLALCLYITCSLTIFLSGSNNQPPMSYLHKEFNVLLNKKHQRIFPTTILASLKTLVIFDISQQIFNCCIDRRYNRHEMSASPFTIWWIFYSTTKK